jgi:hypothetical protein
LFSIQCYASADFLSDLEPFSTFLGQPMRFPSGQAIMPTI